eukprot:2052151-Rhodomonas_salina.2
MLRNLPYGTNRSPFFPFPPRAFFGPSPMSIILEAEIDRSSDAFRLLLRSPIIPPSPFPVGACAHASGMGVIGAGEAPRMAIIGACAGLAGGAIARCGCEFWPSFFSCALIRLNRSCPRIILLRQHSPFAHSAPPTATPNPPLPP